MSGFRKHIAALVAMPSPVVGEGITADQRNLGWVRGPVSETALLKQPLTRLRFAEPPSPTRGGGIVIA
jgi:hypothetical protein